MSEMEDRRRARVKANEIYDALGGDEFWDDKTPIEFIMAVLSSQATHRAGSGHPQCPLHPPGSLACADVLTWARSRFLEECTTLYEFTGDERGFIEDITEAINLARAAEGGGDES